MVECFVVMAEKRKRKHPSRVEPTTLVQAASDLCKIFSIDVKGMKSTDGLCSDFE